MCTMGLTIYGYALVTCRSSWKNVVAVVLLGCTNLARTTAKVPSSKSVSTRLYANSKL